MKTLRHLQFFFCLLVFISISTSTFATPIHPGNGKYTVNLQAIPFDVFTYKPNCPPKGILVVLHGIARDAENYRNITRGLGDRLCRIVVAPRFDAKHFPSWRYQRGGIVHHNAVQKPRDWTGEFIVELIAWVRQQEGEALPYAIIAHSAGAQFLSRLAAFTATEATHMVIANPSTYVLADLQIKAPYGFGGVYPADVGESELKRYLKTPVTILLGEEDVKDKGLDKSPAALAQGKNRYVRGLNAFHGAEALARSRGWVFNWRLMTVPGVGHSAGGMFSSQEVVEALSP